MRRDDLLARASPSLRGVLEKIAASANEVATPVWLVGGPVRDLLAGVDSCDIDLVVLDDVARFSARLAEVVQGSVHEYRSYLTAEVIGSGPFVVDVNRARAERYEQSGALPVVRPGTLLEDLARRDFTVNALALPLTGTDAGLLDPFGGVEDLSRRKLRILHRRSFIDDPTRLLRGLRLAGRLALGFDGETLALACRAVETGAFESVSGARLVAELRLLLGSIEGSASLLPLFEEVSLQRALGVDIPWPADLGKHLERLAAARRRETATESVWLLLLALVVRAASQGQRAGLSERLRLAARAREVLTRSIPAASEVASDWQRLDSASDRFLAIDGLDAAARDLLRATAPEAVRRFIESEWPGLRGRRPAITGRDLLEAGCEPGPAIGRALSATLRARIEGSIGPQDELRYALGVARGAGGRVSGGGHSGGAAGRFRNKPRCPDGGRRERS